jgi:hypothetical protein
MPAAGGMSCDSDDVSGDESIPRFDTNETPERLLRIVAARLRSDSLRETKTGYGDVDHGNKIRKGCRTLVDGPPELGGFTTESARGDDRLNLHDPQGLSR